MIILSSEFIRLLKQHILYRSQSREPCEDVTKGGRFAQMRSGPPIRIPDLSKSHTLESPFRTSDRMHVIIDTRPCGQGCGSDTQRSHRSDTKF